jgi:hypothetical protein
MPRDLGTRQPILPPSLCMLWSVIYSSCFQATTNDKSMEDSDAKLATEPMKSSLHIIVMLLVCSYLKHFHIIGHGSLHRPCAVCMPLPQVHTMLHCKLTPWTGIEVDELKRRHPDHHVSVIPCSPSFPSCQPCSFCLCLVFFNAAWSVALFFCNNKKGSSIKSMDVNKSQTASKKLCTVAVV